MYLGDTPARCKLSHSPSAVTHNSAIHWRWVLQYPIISFMMGDRDSPNTCLSSNEHGGSVRDTFLHYFGCLTNAQREIYFETLPQHEKDRIKAEKSRIAAQRAYFEGGDETKGMVDRLKRYLHTRFPSLADRENALPIPTWPTKDNAFGLSAYRIFFKNSEPFTDTHYPDQYPNQRIAVKDLLDKNVETNPLMQKCGDNEIRYFHLPGNNMEWIEVSMLSMSLASADTFIGSNGSVLSRGSPRLRRSV